MFDKEGEAIQSASVAWSSSADSVASVDDSGLVTALMAGQTRIQAVADTATGYAEVTVDVADEPEPPMSQDRDALVALYNATDGPNWNMGANWLGDTPLDQWHGVITDASGNVERLFLDGNGLNGALPDELGDLAGLKGMNLSNNALSGAIPSALGNSTEMEFLVLSANELTGSIPATLGNLTSLEHLELSNNNLTGALPAEMGGMRSLSHLALSRNDLSGALPTELANLSALGALLLDENPNLSGPLPIGLKDIEGLETINVHRTGLCIPRDAEFTTWFLGISLLGDGAATPACAPETGSFAYLTQATQSFKFPVTLVAGKDALLRVFLTSGTDEMVSLPPVRATFYQAGASVHVADIPGKATSIPASIDEGSLTDSLNELIPGSVISPGLELVIEVDPDGTLPDNAGVARRIPATGSMSVEVLTVPTLNLTMIPLMIENDPDSVNIVAQIEEDANDASRFWLTRNLLPVNELVVTTRDPYTTSYWPSNLEGTRLMWEMNMLRTTDGATGFYLGILRGGGGTALTPGFVAVSDLGASTIAHELGHNMNLLHAPCGNPIESDPNYPDANAYIGAWGYDMRDRTLKDPREYYDMMSYCRPAWISPYSFNKAIRYRHFNEADEAVVASYANRVLLLWGGIDDFGDLVMEHSYVLVGPAALPRWNGPYRLTGLTADGRTLFHLRFPMIPVDGGEGGAFAFTVPVSPAWASLLDRIVLSGPGGVVEINRDGNRSSALLLDPRDGKVRGYLRDWPYGTETLTARRSTAVDGLDIKTSRGVPGARAWIQP